MPSRIARRVLLIGWDAADWQHITPLLEEGLLPGLDYLINHGVMGNLSTMNPVLSPMLWNSIATGVTPDKHGVLGFIEPVPGRPGVRPVASTQRKVKAIWNILHQSGMRSNVIGWWASHPAEPINGVMVSNLFNGIARNPQGELAIQPNLIHPPERAKELAALKVEINEIGADDVLPFIPQAKKIDQESDRRLFSFRKILSDCASYHAVTTRLLEDDRWDLTALYLDAIDHFCHAFMQYHPPRMPNTADDDFEIYKDVIRGAYIFHDMMLQRLIQLAGPDTTVVLCSDHGFHSKHMRPLTTPLEPAGPASWHRNHGVVLISGPGIKQDDRVYGANIIDITPTLLHLFGLPVGEDMDGRVLMDIFKDPHPPAMIPSWENVPGECGKLTETEEPAEADEPEGRELVKQFVALGYVEDPGDDLEKAALRCQMELDYNLARVYLSSLRSEKALPLLLDLVQKSSWEDRFWKFLAQCLYESGYYRQAIEIMEQLYAGVEIPAQARLLQARCYLALADSDRVQEILDGLERLELRQPNLLVIVGEIYLAIRRPQDAERAFRKALEADPDCATALQGLSSVFLKEKEFEKAVDSALDAVTLLYRLPRAHWNLGVGLAQLGLVDRAVATFERVIRFNDHRLKAGAHFWLARLHRQTPGSPQGDQHSRLARTIHSTNATTRRKRQQHRETLLELPPVPTFDVRKETHMRERPIRRKEAAEQEAGRSLVLVSGLPRSGTSLMMQMLEAGGLPAKTDGKREADQNNPRGYYEWEDVKQIRKRPELLDEEGLEQKVIKVISMLLPGLPKRHQYKIIFMNRPAEQVAYSQEAMIKQLTKGPLNHNIETIQRKLEEHRQHILKWLSAQDNVELLVVDYPELVASPQHWVEEIVKFIGAELLPRPEKMAEQVQPKLHRQRASLRPAKR